MNKTDLQKKMYGIQDLKYRDMQIKTIPTIDPGSIIGVRTPELKNMAKDILKAGDYKEFLKELPHKYFEENRKGLMSGLITRQFRKDWRAEG